MKHVIFALSVILMVCANTSHAQGRTEQVFKCDVTASSKSMVKFWAETAKASLASSGRVGSRFSVKFDLVSKSPDVTARFSEHAPYFVLSNDNVLSFTYGKLGGSACEGTGKLTIYYSALQAGRYTRKTLVVDNLKVVGIFK